MKLYKVKVETDIMVVADSDSAAVEIAKKHAPGEVNIYGKGSAQVVHGISEIPEDWKSVIPYSADGSPETRKCFEIVSASVSAVVKELPKDDVEEIIRIKKNIRAQPTVQSSPEVKPETRPDPTPKEMDWHETKSGRPMPSLRFIDGSVKPKHL